MKNETSNSLQRLVLKYEGLEGRTATDQMANLIASIPRDADGSDNHAALGIIMSVAFKCTAEETNQNLFKAFLWTCHEYGLHGKKLPKIYTDIAKNKLSTCAALIFGINTEVLAAENLNVALNTENAELNIEGIIDELQKN